MVFLRRGKFTFIMCISQVVFLILFGLFADYEPSAKPRKADQGPSSVGMYPMFQDVHVMIFVGFGFLMTFLKRYGFSAVSFNLLISAFVIQWTLIIRGFLHSHVTEGHKFTIGVGDLLSADFGAATVLISFGAVLGKVSPVQLIVMAAIESVLMQLNEYIGLDTLRAEDVGESMYIHAFGAYFGLAVARVLFSEDVEKASAKEGSVYHSDIFSMIGTIFLWMYWPSFNGGAATGDEQHRALINTYMSLVACTVVTFAVSTCVDKHAKLDIIHIQNATLAGGVAVGTTAHMPIDPWGAMLIGCIAGVVSTLGYKYLTPFLSKKLKIHDTCGVNNLHGMPGILAGLGGASVAALANYDKWGDSMFEIFPGIAPKDNTTDFNKYHTAASEWDAGLGRTPHEQGGYQFAALCITLLIAIVGGSLTGLLLKLPFWDNPAGQNLFDDEDFFEVPTEGYPFIEEDKQTPKNESEILLAEKKE